MSKSKPELRVFFCSKETVCADCGLIIDDGEFLFINNAYQHFCLTCADLDHLKYLPSGNTALTLRASKHSKLVAVVYRFSSSRKRNERQGILVENDALQKAQEECLSDEDIRSLRRERDAIKREKQDKQYVNEFAHRLKVLYPNCPSGRELEIAEHACLKYSGRVGRSASAKRLEDYTIDLAVIAHIRHCETNYDELLMQGYDRYDAREIIQDEIDTVINSWQARPI